MIAPLCDGSSIAEARARLIAFYLPQYHPIPENDAWWGKGFTDWANVSKARPNFIGHYQPHLPNELGFYDLRVDEVREGQAQLARQYGVHGFCYYHYWFGGKRLLRQPIDALLASGVPAFPFCICWANENWTRRWDGADQDVLIAQQHSPEDNRAFMRHLFPFFADQRYIRVQGRPLLAVYRIDAIPELARMVEQWREECAREGLPQPYLCAVQSYGFAGDPRPYGFDAAIEFPPHHLLARPLAHTVELTNPFFKGRILSYRAMAADMLRRPWPQYDLFRGVTPSWDNTPRRQDDGMIMLGSSPEAYELWLAGIVEQTCARYDKEHRIVFINAWNEWAEGCHLEPDRRYGCKYLQATQRALEITGGSLGSPSGASAKSER